MIIHFNLHVIADRKAGVFQPAATDADERHDRFSRIGPLTHFADDADETSGAVFCSDVGYNAISHMLDKIRMRVLSDRVRWIIRS